MMTAELLFIFLVIALAFSFDFINGFHDAANSIATIVSTGVLKPTQAVIWAAFFNFIAFLFFHLAVANTIGTGLINPNIVNPSLIFAALSGAIIWNLITCHLGLPSSSSHALMGGLIGAGIVKGGFKVIVMSGFIKIALAIVISPVLGFIMSFLLMRITKKISINWTQAKQNRWFGHAQFVSAAMLSLAHGGNDAQKTMGIIAVLLFSTHLLTGDFYIPLWVVISCNLVMALGTLAGGWKVVDTMGKKITSLTTRSGCSAETGASLTLLLATYLGIPVSTTHIVTGAITGTGLTEQRSIRWGMVRKIVCAWVLTLPMAGLVAGLMMLIIKFI
jgi:PiT family inorganic phosphate transporter